MNRLRRFYETVPRGQTSGRLAYATRAGALFKSLPDGEWAEDTEFNAGEAVLADPTLKDVYKEAILKAALWRRGNESGGQRR
jgi:hypothetical protein